MNIRNTLIFALMLIIGGCSAPEQPTIGLYLAIQRGDIEQIERHIKWGSDIDQIDAQGKRPLHVAAELGDYAIVKLLLKSGAELEAKDRQGQPPLSSALMAGRPRVAELLINQGALLDADQALDRIVSAGMSDRDVIRLLVQQGADINHSSAEGDTPLLAAVRHKDRVMVKNLIAQGADVNQGKGGDQYPLALAEALNEREIVYILERNGAKRRP